MSVTFSEHATTDHEDDAVIVMSADDFQHAAQRALDELGLTYAELEEQAHAGDFTSSQAHALWVSIGGTVDL
jgi:23S rRNA G2069 N7-methylase RlmK/C1962 C5-methylase RlmI